MPRGVVVASTVHVDLSGLRFPLMVKPAFDDASGGIDPGSVVHDVAAATARIAHLLGERRNAVIVEEYIEGREIYIGVIGNDRLTTFPLWELNFGTLPDVMAGIATRKVKWDRAYQQKHGIVTDIARDLPDGVTALLDRMPRRIYRALYISGYARMDLRMRADGSLFFLEANANPNLEEFEDFARAAAHAGITYPKLLERIISLGTSYRAEWRG